MANPDPRGQLDLEAAAIATHSNGTVTTKPYAIGRMRNRMVGCRHCHRENHETRIWCTRCGHGLGMTIETCVCENCLHASKARRA